MPETADKNQAFLTHLKSAIDVGGSELIEINVTEVNLTESLLTPGLQTNVVVQSRRSETPGYVLKNLDNFYAKGLILSLERPIIKAYSKSVESKLDVSQLVYRLSKRKRINYDIEVFELDACDPSLIKDAKTYLSKSWKCKPSSQVVSDILRGCIKAPKIDVENSMPIRDFVAENVHPFQAIFQNSEVALSQDGMDPSFVHYMTYKDFGTHHFRSLTSLAKASPVWKFVYSDKGATDLNFASPVDIMNFDFPCDFDLLSDVLNGYDENGKDITVVSTFNSLTGKFGMFGEPSECGNSPFMVSTNQETESDQNSCNPNIEKYLVKRKPRMALLDQDKIALKMVVPFSPFLHAGDVIEAEFPNKGPSEGILYGSGKYLISSMTHNIKAGGLGITTLECVSNTVAAGRV
jgi:hypothetical protein